ncbi:DUF6438 domain-containing protein [Chloroflexota bacterium]
MKKYLSVISIFLLVIAMPIGCNSTMTPVPNNIKEVVITLERTACFGVCPVYTLTIYGDGRVVYEGMRNVRIEGTRTTTINEDSIKQLIAEFQKIDYFSLKDSYEERNATDMPSAYTSLTVDGKTKTVRHYHGDFSAPKKLTELENKIDQIVHADQWTQLWPNRGR